MRNLHRIRITVPVLILLTMWVSVPAFAQLDLSGQWTWISGDDRQGTAFAFCYGYITALLQSIGEPRRQAWVTKGPKGFEW